MAVCGHVMHHMMYHVMYYIIPAFRDAILLWSRAILPISSIPTFIKTWKHTHAWISLITVSSWQNYLYEQNSSDISSFIFTFHAAQSLVCTSLTVVCPMSWCRMDTMSISIRRWFEMAPPCLCLDYTSSDFTPSTPGTPGRPTTTSLTTRTEKCCHGYKSSSK